VKQTDVGTDPEPGGGVVENLRGLDKRNREIIATLSSLSDAAGSGRVEMMRCNNTASGSYKYGLTAKKAVWKRLMRISQIT
jgi:hypothetical protein